MGYAVLPKKSISKIGNPTVQCSVALNRAAGKTKSAVTLVATTESSQRRERLLTLLELRRVYRDIMHANMILQVGSPVYEPTSSHEEIAGGPENHAHHAVSLVSSTEWPSESMEEDEKEKALVEQQKRDKALSIVADMQLTSDQLKVGVPFVFKIFKYDRFCCCYSHSPDQSKLALRRLASGHFPTASERFLGPRWM